MIYHRPPEASCLRFRSMPSARCLLARSSTCTIFRRRVRAPRPARSSPHPRRPSRIHTFSRNVLIGWRAVSAGIQLDHFCSMLIRRSGISLSVGEKLHSGSCAPRTSGLSPDIAWRICHLVLPRYFIHTGRKIVSSGGFWKVINFQPMRPCCIEDGLLRRYRTPPVQQPGSRLVWPVKARLHDSEFAPSNISDAGVEVVASLKGRS